MGKYDVREVTLEDMRCALLSCPSVYEVTPKDMECSLVACPAVYEIGKKYFIIGEKIDAKDFGLEKKVGKKEVLIRVDKKLIDEMER